MKATIRIGMLLLLLAGIVFGQSPKKQSADLEMNIPFTFGGIWDVGWRVEVDNAGYAYIGGCKHDSSNTWGRLNAALARFSPTGQKLWQVTDSLEAADGMGTTSIALWSGGVYWGENDTVIGKIHKLDSKGKTLWTINSDYRWLASFNDTLVTAESFQSGDLPVQVISPDGKTIASYTLPFQGAGWIRTMKVRDGFLYIVFCTYYQTPDYYGPALGHIVKADVMTGDIIQELSFPGFVKIFCDVDSRGNIYLGGSRFTSFPVMEFVMGKYDPSGNSVWEKTWFSRHSTVANSNNWTNGLAYNEVTDRLLLIGNVDTGEVDLAYNSYAVCRNASTGDSLWTLDFSFIPGSIISCFQDGVAFKNGWYLVGSIAGRPGDLKSVEYIQQYNTLTPVVEPPEPPRDFRLDQNYPNPFNPTTTLSFMISKRSFVNVEVYDILGRKVATLVNEEKSPGTYSVQFNGSGLASGIYFYRLRTETSVSTKKMMLMK